MNQPRSANYTILVIDDDPGLLELAAELLSGDGHRVLVASRGEDALAMVRAVHPDLILLDYYMPDMNGLAVIEQLKADAATRRIPVVALTSGTAEDANNLSRAGSVGFILKPFEPGEFLRLIAGLLNATVGRRRSEGPAEIRSLCDLEHLRSPFSARSSLSLHRAPGHGLPGGSWSRGRSFLSAKLRAHRFQTMNSSSPQSPWIRPRQERFLDELRLWHDLHPSLLGALAGGAGGGHFAPGIGAVATRFPSASCCCASLKSSGSLGGAVSPRSMFHDAVCHRSPFGHTFSC